MPQVSAVTKGKWLHFSFVFCIAGWVSASQGAPWGASQPAAWVLLILHFSSSWIHPPLNTTSLSLSFSPFSFFFFPSFPPSLSAWPPWERDDGNVAESNYPPHPISSIISCVISNTLGREGSRMLVYHPDSTGGSPRRRDSAGLRAIADRVLQLGFPDRPGLPQLSPGLKCTSVPQCPHLF